MASQCRSWRNSGKAGAEAWAGPDRGGIFSWLTSARNAWEAPGSSANHSILRWNGTKWKKATSSTQSLNYFGMAATSARNAWAVGDAPGTVLNTDVLIMHWNGASWKRQPA